MAEQDTSGTQNRQGTLGRCQRAAPVR